MSSGNRRTVAVRLQPMVAQDSRVASASSTSVNTPNLCARPGVHSQRCLRRVATGARQQVGFSTWWLKIPESLLQLLVPVVAATIVRVACEPPCLLSVHDLPQLAHCWCSIWAAVHACRRLLVAFC